MGSYWSLPLIVLAVVLQSSVIPQIRIFGGEPDLVLLLVLSWSVNGRLEQDVTWAFVGGIAQDLMSATPLGASVIGLVLLVFSIDQLKQQVYRIGFMLIIALVIVGTVLQKVMLMIIAGFSGFTVAPIQNLTYVILPTIAYNLIFIGPVYWIVRRIQRRSQRRDQQAFS